MITLYRRLTHTRLAQLTLSGKVLDLGGSKRSTYGGLIQGEHTYTVVNTDEGALPDVVWDLEETPYPFADGSHDAVLAINLMEHLWHWRELLTEAHRILTPGGSIVIVVPFLHAIHPSPHDYFRFTKEGLERALRDAGFTADVEEIGAGVFVARYAVVARFLPSSVARLCEPLALFMDRALAGLSRRLGKKYEPADYPLGYLAVGKKR